MPHANVQCAKRQHGGRTDAPPPGSLSLPVHCASAYCMSLRTSRERPSMDSPLTHEPCSPPPLQARHHQAAPSLFVNSCGDQVAAQSPTAGAHRQR
eukprot:6094773-Prymnesium_polylepis.1